MSLKTLNEDPAGRSPQERALPKKKKLREEDGGEGEEEENEEEMMNIIKERLR